MNVQRPTFNVQLSSSELSRARCRPPLNVERWTLDVGRFPHFPSAATSRPLRLFLALFFLLPIALHAADAPSPAETKLRESVRALTLQLRTAESDKATMQAAQAEADHKVTDLTAQLEKYKAQLLAVKEAADKALAELNEKITAKDAEIANGKRDLASWKKGHAELKAAYEKVVAIGNAKEAERAKLAARVIVLDRQVVEQRARNAALYQTGTEVLSRYEKFGLGTALTSREPFVGTTKVKFENLIQDYSDQLADQKIKVEEKPPAPAASAPEKAEKTSGKKKQP